MSGSLRVVPIESPGQLIRFSAADAANRYASLAESPATMRAYESDWKHFRLWCQSRQLNYLPATPETVALYIADCASTGLMPGRKPSNAPKILKSGKPAKKKKAAAAPVLTPASPATISRRLASISRVHAQAGFESPTAMRHACVKAVWSGIRRDKGVAQVQKAAIVTDYLKLMLDDAPATLRGLRDRALLLIGFAAALRRSELVALTVRDIRFGPKGIEVTIRASKTDQEKRGEKVAVPPGKTEATCAVANLRAWLAAAEITHGPLFRAINRWGKVQASPLDVESIALIVKKYTKLAGFDPTVFSGHSLRAGLATSAANAGASERAIMKQTRHKTEAMVRRYIRDANLFNQNVLDLVAL